MNNISAFYGQVTIGGIVYDWEYSLNAEGTLQELECQKCQHRIQEAVKNIFQSIGKQQLEEDETLTCSSLSGIQINQNSLLRVDSSWQEHLQTIDQICRTNLQNNHNHDDADSDDNTQVNSVTGSDWNEEIEEIDFSEEENDSIDDEWIPLGKGEKGKGKEQLKITRSSSNTKSKIKKKNQGSVLEGNVELQ